MSRTIPLLFCWALAIPPLAAQSRLPALATATAATSLPATGATAAEPAAAPVVYYTAEQMPAFPGGAAALLQFLKRKVQYPKEALLRNVEGQVHLHFIVDEEGRLLDPYVVRGLGSGLDEEALRLVRIMPWWTPGRINGHPVRVAYTLPIAFRLVD